MHIITYSLTSADSINYKQSISKIKRLTLFYEIENATIMEDVRPPHIILCIGTNSLAVLGLSIDEVREEYKKLK